MGRLMRDRLEVVRGVRITGMRRLRAWDEGTAVLRGILRGNKGVREVVLCGGAPSCSFSSGVAGGMQGILPEPATWMPEGVGKILFPNAFAKAPSPCRKPRASYRHLFISIKNSRDLSCPPSNRALHRRLATEAAFQRSSCAIPTTRTTTRSSSCPP